MPTYQDSSRDGSPSCNGCGVDIPEEDIAGPDGTIALTVEEYLHLLHLAGYGVFCEACIDGRQVDWQLTPQQFADHPPKRVAA